MNVAIASRLRMGIGNLRERLAGREDREHVQAMVRMAFGLIISAYLYLAAGARFNILVVCIGFEVFASAILLAIVIHPQRSPLRRGLGTILDLGTTTYLMWANGEIGAPLYFIYLWVTLGNGFGYGVRSLYASQTMSIAGFASVVAFNPFWHHHSLMAGGFLIMLAVIPYDGGVFLKRVKATQDKAELASEAQSRLLSMTSHGIRTLLDIFIEINAALGKTALTPRQVDIITARGTFSEILMSRLDNDLDSTRIEAAKMTIGHVGFDLHAVTNRAMKAAATRVAGVKAFLTRPINRKMLFETIRALKGARDRHGEEAEGAQPGGSEPKAVLPSESVLDHTVLAELAQCSNSPQFVAQVVDAFESDMLGLIERLKMAVKSEDWPEIAEIRHAIERNARDSGAAAIVGLIESLRSLDAIEPMEREKRIGELCACFATTLDAMREFVRQRQMRPPADAKRAPLPPRPS